MARHPTAAALKALDRAQDLMYRAWEAPSAARRVALAEEALALSPLCADAHVLLAQHSLLGSEAALDHWRRGVEAGKAALGMDFDELAGQFWGFLETRPYMRARHGLALALWARGARDEAIGHLRAMLELNPGDNQGLRYTLAAWLLQVDRPDDLAALLAAYADDGMAAWTWTAALAAFRREGDGPESRRLLAEATRSNAHVPAYLLGIKRLPKTLSPFIGPGQPNEAEHYAAECRPIWTAIPGALRWLRGQASAAGPRPAPPGRGKRR